MVSKTSRLGNLSERISSNYSCLSFINAILVKRVCMFTGVIAIGCDGGGKILPWVTDGSGKLL